VNPVGVIEFANLGTHIPKVHGRELEDQRDRRDRQPVPGRRLEQMTGTEAEGGLLAR
jgi:hypothetical protein